MKKITFLFSVFFVVIMLFVNDSVYANKKEVEIVRTNINWLNKSYAPKLYLQPYFNLTGLNAVKAAACSVQVLPFWEGFNKNSGTLSCWTILDVNADATTSSNIWKVSTTKMEGDQSMYFYGTTGKTHDDWLITPDLSFDATKVYRLKYNYRTTVANYNHEIEVLLSTTGVSSANFTKSVIPKKMYGNSAEWQQEVAFISGVSGLVNIGFHVVSTGVTYLYIDNLSIEEVATCPEPLNLNIKSLKKDQVSLLWDDNFAATNWEYFIQKPTGVVPTTAGIATSSKTGTLATKDGLGANLVAGTTYEYYVRTVCSAAAYSVWSGPFLFTTPCAETSLPFWEGFNLASTTFNCWNIVDANKDSSSPTGSYIWRLYSTLSGVFEGDRCMYFTGTSKNDDYLISPIFKFDATKTYKLTYHYKTSTAVNEFEVLASNNGTAIDDFTTVILAKKIYSSATWAEETIYVTNLGGDVSFAWHVTNPTSATVYLDNVFIEEASCVVPLDLAVKDIKPTEVTLLWNDKVNKVWEYYVQSAGGALPVGSGTSTQTTELVVTKDNSNNNLTARKDYEFYIRAKCVDGKFGDWVGPFVFTTACNPVNLPLSEGFNVNSPSFSCWKVTDNNDDVLSTGNNSWRQYATGPYEGDRSMYFYSSIAATTHDDWLISPTVKMTGGIYAITYYYKTSASNSNDFEVVLSKDGVKPVDFKMIIEPSEKRNTTAYVKKILYVKDIIGDVNIAWHVKSSGITTVYVDLASIEKIDCIAPDQNVVLTALDKGKATFTWTDTNNANWEVFTQLQGTGTMPVGSGSVAPKPTFDVTKTNGAGATNLLPDTWYEFFVRSSCGAGKNSQWVGPIAFKTPCDFASLPYWEGFNKNSTNLSCWTIVDNNKDATSLTSSGIWKTISTNQEGDQSMYFYATSSPQHDDWLISPGFKLDATKYYRLKYYYRTSTTYKNDFEVVLSNKGILLTDFTQVLQTKKAVSSNDWVEETIIIGKVGGDVNIAWHVNTAGTATYLYVDAVSLEEIKGCPEPMNLGSKDVKETTANIFWTENYGSSWEYFVQEAGAPSPVGNGTVTTNKEAALTKEQSGKNLLANTEYEFYVRSVCGNGEFSVWSGPFLFRTACSVYTTPFWEGFNSSDKSVNCWTIIDENKDATTATGSNIWKTVTTKFEGSHSMYFYGSNADVTKIPHNDWLVSPKIKFEPTKTYRLKYHYRTTTTLTYDYEFEVLLSTAGLDTKNFTTVVVPKSKYAPSTVWTEEYVFITGVSGEVNIAWHVTASSQYTYLYVDNVFVEEVTGCPEPLNMAVKDIATQKATINWTDNFGATKWEYYVQEAGKGLPTGAGTATTQKENVLTKMQSGKNLEANTDYEFYVRTVCGNGAFSIWRGPVAFATICEIYPAPFWEGFNKDSKTTRCWTVLDKTGLIIPMGTTWKTNTSSYEGDQAMYYYLYDADKVPNDDYLISPTITLDGGAYILKYHYKTSTTATYNNEFEVLLSTQGIETNKFTTTLLGLKNYYEGNYVEEVIFLDNIKGNVNIAWHGKSKNTTATYLYLDNITLKKIESCPEPHYVQTSNHTSTSMDVVWKQTGGITSWEVIVVGVSDDHTAIPVKSINVVGTPAVTINGLDSAKGYKIYVRAKCLDGKSFSDWSTASNGGTLLDKNDECSGAVNIPVNTSLECVKIASGSLFGATKSATATVPIQFPTPSCSASIVNDAWFEFTAVAASHSLSIKDLVSVSGKTASPLIYFALYDQPCGSITAAALQCFSLSRTSNNKLLTNLIPGQKYYLRLGVSATTASDLVFNLCLVTSKYTPLEVSPSGDKYNVDELIKDVFVKSNCDLVSNVTYQVGDGGPLTKAINTVGYFSKAGSNFPFEEGIVLGTSEIKYVAGPHIGANSARGSNPHRWAGDKDINDAIKDAGGGPLPQKRVTQIEFDFIPIKDAIKFEYLFASNSYINGCTYDCNTGALFAAWLIDSTTGEGQNLAKIKGTQTPISLNTIRDATKSGIDCGSVNPEYYWKHFDNNQDHPIDAPIDFVGLTKAMESETVVVVPGRKYHIKLAVMDFCTNNAHTSAVFFNAGSFDLGDLDLGADMLVEEGNALCNGECVTIKSGLGTEETTITWYKDDVVIAGANKPDLQVCESGEYKVVGKYNAINCEVKGVKRIEIYPAISKVIATPDVLSICRTALAALTLDLTEVETAMLAKVDPLNYKFVYFTSKEDAVAKLNSIPNPKEYQLETKGVNSMLYIYVEDVRTGCSEIFEWTLKATAGIIPTAREDVRICGSYTFPALESGQHYYTATKATGVEYKGADVLNVPGTYTFFVFQDNGGGCYEEISFKLDITAPVKAAVFGDVELECHLHALAALPANNKYFSQAGGQGMELAVGSLVPLAQTIYVYASSDDGLCLDESSFKVSYIDCPIPKGVSPNGDGLNDRFDLKEHGVTSMVIYNRYGAEVYSFQGAYTDQWYGQEKGDKLLPDGTYYYVVIAHGKTRTGWVQINK
ncbi:choice-of-anchor J domain-containing protein [Flavobacterium sp. HSC-61S13]|uniref:choice-of-anchor J domain-containing protein n=1 Tax=Flavobacterium sp. HSC-61S13 TaxID=2910963 RepID=UPI00209CE2D1|nr:choice-of-anchor J domain-containing protein [Flavobacterium sp. HSC-61S13]MCP1995106.1 gliding motility-associated-like protein [Flavobacterium sp. HSC-61S13]